jgi:hypothetical protein
VAEPAWGLDRRCEVSVVFQLVLDSSCVTGKERLKRIRSVAILLRPVIYSSGS